MAAAHPVGPLGRPIRFDESKYPFWRDHIQPEIRHLLVEEDVRAGETIVVEMLAILATAIALGAAAVILTCL